MLGISDAAESIGFRTSGLRITFKQLVEDVPLPCILHWSQKHFVVCYDIRKKKDGYRIAIADPANQLVTYKEDEFKKCWKGNWKQSVPAGVLFCTLLAMECIAAWYYMFMQSEMNVLLVAFVAFSLLLLTICWLFTTLQMLYLDMPLGGMLKNSLLIMFGYAKRTLPAGLITLVIVIGVVLFVPVPIMLLLLFLGMPALVAVIGDMWAWPVMEQAFHISEQQAARRAEQEGRE